MKVACLSDLGRVRDINEDSYEYAEIKDDCILLVVADGMGGHNAGEVASSIAVKSIKDYIVEKIGNSSDNREIEGIIKEAILKANNDIYTESLKVSMYSGMGTTVTLGVLLKDSIIIGHVGDSRAYLYRNGEFQKLTDDHSLVAELVKNGTITEDEALHHPQKNIITRALGVNNELEIDIVNQEIKSGDMYLFCTDGLTNMLSDSELKDILSKSSDVDSAVHQMIDIANERGGYDNITVVIASAVQDGEVKK